MHRIEICQYGNIHGQCRCPSRDKARVKVVCDIRDHALAATGTQPKHRRTDVQALESEYWARQQDLYLWDQVPPPTRLPGGAHRGDRVVIY